MEFIDLNNKQSDLNDPPGRQKKVEDYDKGNNSELKKIMQNRAWTTAISPLTSIFMYVIMFWMMGNSLNIYTLIMICSVGINQIKGIFGVNEKFKVFEQHKFEELSFYKLVYLLVNLAILLFIAYKLFNLGLLPLSPADYVELLPVNNFVERVVLKK